VVIAGAPAKARSAAKTTAACLPVGRHTPQSTGKQKNQNKNNSGKR